MVLVRRQNTLLNRPTRAFLVFVLRGCSTRASAIRTNNVLNLPPSALCFLAVVFFDGRASFDGTRASRMHTLQRMGRMFNKVAVKKTLRNYFINRAKAIISNFPDSLD